MNLLEILQSFDSPIEEEQAWAICFQCAKFMKNQIGSNEALFASLNRLDSLELHVDGQATICGTPCVVEAETVKLLGLVLFSALDFGFKPDEQQILSEEMDMLLSQMTGEVSAGNDCVFSAVDLLRICQRRLPATKGADAHYRAVIASMLTEAEQLKAFLNKVATANQGLQRLTDDPGADDVVPAEFTEWAHCWLPVLDELHLGATRLRKVEHPKHRLEAEQTPHEALMEEIRKGRFRLNQAPPSRPTRKSAHDAILDFIRSKPSLSPAHERLLPPAPPRSKSLHDRLIEQIQEQSVPLKPVRPSATRHHRGAQGDNGPPRRRLPKPSMDEVIISEFIESDSDADLMERTIVDEDSTINLSSYNCTRDSMTSSRRSSESSLSDASDPLGNPPTRRVLPLESTPEKSFLAPLFSSFRLSSGLRRSQSVAFSDRTKIPPDNRSPPMRRTYSERRTQKSTRAECLTLTVGEVMHIRQVMSRDRLERLQSSKELYLSLRDGKVCFRCHVKKFGLFVWPYTCRLCERKVCAGCVRKMKFSSDLVIRAPLHVIASSGPPPLNTDPRYSTSQNKSRGKKVEVCLDCHVIVNTAMET